MAWRCCRCWKDGRKRWPIRSGWFWGQPEWERYQQAYYAGRERPEEYKSSPLDPDGHDFNYPAGEKLWKTETHLTQVIDLRLHQWSDVRESYHSIIHRANDQYGINHHQDWPNAFARFVDVHRAKFGACRSNETFNVQYDWWKNGSALVVCAWEGYIEIARVVAAAFWIVYNGCAYYASGPSLEKNVQHAVILESLVQLKARGITLVEMGQTDGATEKERNIAKFKRGFGGSERPYMVIRRCAL